MSVGPKTKNEYIESAKATMAANASAYKVDPAKANVFDTIGNFFTGNLDYAREVAKAERAEATSAREAAKAREWSAREAQKQREWEEMMSNTAYSRAVKDLKSVGINPYAIGSFNAASTPSGAYGQSFAGSGYVGSANASHNVANSAIKLIDVLISLFLHK